MDDSQDAAPSAFWIEAPGRGALRAAPLGPLEAGQVRVRALFGAISRGTEATVFAGAVPASEHERMRAPFQEGAFPAPVKYGYATVGRVVASQADLAPEAQAGAAEGDLVLVLHPHQTRFDVPQGAAMVLPQGVPPERAVLGPNMETALNLVWDAGLQPGDRVVVVGGGLIGLLVAFLAAAIPGTEVTVIDREAAREAVAIGLGARFAAPGQAPSGCDVAIHASGTDEGLGLAIEACGFEGRIVEASWFGTRPATLLLGGAFHSQRLSIIASQVGTVPAARRARWSRERRLHLALSLLKDARLDALISGETPFEALPEVYGAVLAAPDTLCHRIRYRA
ncbi:zinc-binding alcohol dehydrogenase [Aurantimonas sp. Leaf443]|uniref:zinc-dependent alcohol dehydrogenase n=1 Tax=Aurantimonas sp. Leaf443 TaxID=1736378 RepID=UPI0007019433|nr:zinc-binding alcohol dehydrogenase [Aurantimonas sp. Leaf443]KQT85148.1 dehydrogenase [Aurantimonas sp. Leaf443]